MRTLSADNRNAGNQAHDSDQTGRQSKLRAFLVAGGRITGTDHRRAGRACQDAFAWTRSERALVAAVCDGCGSGAYSEAGAIVGAQLWCNALLDQIAACLGEPDRNESGDVDSGDVDNDPIEDLATWHRHIWPAARSRVAETLACLARSMGGPFDRIMTEHFLFTVVGAAVTGSMTVVFSLGDGVAAVNREIHCIGPYPDNQPPYLAYDCMPGVHMSGGAAMPMEVHAFVPTDGVNSILLATDGAAALVPGNQDGAWRAAVPGRDEPAGDFLQFAGTRYLRNRDAIRRRLAVLNRDACTLDQGRMRRSPGLLADDTAIVAIGRDAEVAE